MSVLVEQETKDLPAPEASLLAVIDLWPSLEMRTCMCLKGYEKLLPNYSVCKIVLKAQKICLLLVKIK